MEYNHCDGACKKAGKQRNGTQKYRCKGCGKYQQAAYVNKAYQVGTNAQIVYHVKEGCGIWNKNRGIRRFPRLLRIAKGTGTLRIPRFFARIKRIAEGIKPVATVNEGQSYEVDELHTFIGSKDKVCSGG